MMSPDQDILRQSWLRSTQVETQQAEFQQKKKTKKNLTGEMKAEAVELESLAC